MKRSLLVLAAVLALGGCGAHTGADRKSGADAGAAAFSGALNQLCKTFTLKSAVLGKPATVPQLILVMGKAIPYSRVLLEGAERLHAPASMRARFKSFLGLEKQQLTLSLQVLSAAEHGSVTQMDTLLAQSRALNKPSDADVRVLHAHWCLSTVTGPPKKHKKPVPTIAV